MFTFLFSWLIAGLIAESIVLGTWRNTTLIPSLWERMVIERYESFDQWKQIAFGWMGLVLVMIFIIQDGDFKNIRFALPPFMAKWFISKE